MNTKIGDRVSPNLMHNIRGNTNFHLLVLRNPSEQNNEVEHEKMRLDRAIDSETTEPQNPKK